MRRDVEVGDALRGGDDVSMFACEVRLVLTGTCWWDWAVDRIGWAAGPRLDQFNVRPYQVSSELGLSTEWYD